jgi:hypothetical protein
MIDPHTRVAAMTLRMKRLPRRHRIAHLRALIQRQSSSSLRRDELAELLRAEIAARSARGNVAP